jgi:transcriptional regulator with XRE-family HTH domain
MAKRQDPTQEFLVAVGDKIRYYRRRKGFTLEALGEDIGLDKSNMHHIEAGKNITLLTLLKIALFLEVEPAKLLQTDTGLSLEDAEDYVVRRKEKLKRARRKSSGKKKRK